ncbi:hypothetical protein MRX96_014616 [Rhipicephalus microplus]
MKEVVDRSTGESLQELDTTPNSPWETRQVGVRQEDNLPAPDNTMDLSATGPEAPPRPNDDAMKQERRHSKGYAKSAQASHNTHSQILLGSEGHPARPQTQHPVLLRHPQPGTTKHPQKPTDPQKTEHWAKVSPVGLLFPETRSNDVIPQAVQPQQSPPWQGNIQPPYLTQPMGALPIGLDLARMIADMVQH